MRKLLFSILFLTVNIYGQRVQLSSIPGQDGDININDMLNQIMAPYYQELSNIQNKVRDKELEFQLLRDFRTNIDNFDRINRYIFGYESSFRSLTNEISDPTALSLQVDRTAKKGTYNIKIKQLADHDAFSSPAISLDKILPAGIFHVKIDEISIPVNFTGGNIISLADTLQKTTSNLIDVKVINTSDKTRTISISSKKTGEKYKIHFDGNLAPLTTSEILSKGKREEKQILWPDNKTNLQISNNTFSLDLKEKISPNSSISFQVKITEIPKDTNDTNKQNISLSNLQKESIGSFNIEKITIPGISPILEDFSKNETTNTNKVPEQYLTLKFTDNVEEKIILSNASFNIDLKKYTEKCLLNIQVVSEAKIA
ncbi:MAG: flagellar cap protein FliD N-terminal domain-containing protein, partial [Brevinema sp.]